MHEKILDNSIVNPRIYTVSSILVAAGGPVATAYLMAKILGALARMKPQNPYGLYVFWLL
jgi:hypothetical protein